MVRELSRHGRVLITSESELPKEFEKYRINIRPEKIHDLLYYSSMYVGEGATMATEAGILGTPSIYISSLTGTMGNFEELGEKYGLVYSFKNLNSALFKINELLEKNDIPDLILLDIMMPEISGWELAKRLKKNTAWKNIPIVFLTARTSKIAKTAGGLLGEDYIEKPFDKEDLNSFNKERFYGGVYNFRTSS